MATDAARASPPRVGHALGRAFAAIFQASSGNGARRADVLGDSLGLFETYALRRAPNGYPRVQGLIGGREVRLSFVQDTLAIKRLPQLWLSFVLYHGRPCAPLTLTARPRGDDYVSLRPQAGIYLDVPAWLPRDFAVFGGPDAASRLEDLRGPLECSFRDPNVKEIVIAPRRIHLLYRLSEGRRGRHLLFREPVFDDVLTRETLLRLVDETAPIASAIADPAPLFPACPARAATA